MDLRFSYNPFVDPMLGTGVKTRRIMGSSLCQVCVCRYRNAGSGRCRSILGWFVDLTLLSGSRADVATSQVVQWLVFCCDVWYGQVLLHISLFARLCAKIMDPRRTPVPGLQSDIPLVCLCAFPVLLMKFAFASSLALLGCGPGQLVHLILCPDRCARRPDHHWWHDSRSGQQGRQVCIRWPSTHVLHPRPSSWQSVSKSQQRLYGCLCGICHPYRLHDSMSPRSGLAKERVG